MNAGDLIIRPSVAADIPAITAIYGHSVATACASFELTPPGEQEMAERRHSIVTAGYPYLVATIDSVVVGFAYASAYRTRPAYAGTVENSVYVREDIQKRGLGRALMERVIAEVEARGFRQMIAVIGDSTNLASVRLHEKLGFRPVGTFQSVGWKHGRWVDTVLMQRAIGPGESTAYR